MGVILEPISFQSLRSFARKEKKTVSSDELRIPTRCSYFPDLVTSQIPSVAFQGFHIGGLSLESRTHVGPRAQQWAEELSLGEALSGAADWSHSRQRKSRRVWIRVWSWQPPRHLQSCFLHGVLQSPWGNQFPELLLGDMDTGFLCLCI